MKPSLCHGLLLVCLSFSTPSWAEDDAVLAAYVPTVDPVEDPTQRGPIVQELVDPARLIAGMDGQELDGGRVRG